MSRIAYRYLPREMHAAGYLGGLPRTREDFEALVAQRWVQELHEALLQVLDQSRSILSVGSGVGEHELLLARAGFSVTATDIDPDVLAPAELLYPELDVRVFDILDPDISGGYDDMLVTGLDYALDDNNMRALFRNARSLLAPDGRLLFVHRFNDNSATKLIDRALVPIVARLQNARATRAGGGPPLVRVRHGIRRSRREILVLGEAEGWTARRRFYAGFASELDRIALELHVPGLYRRLQNLDKRLHVLNIATVFEFVQR